MLANIKSYRDFGQEPSSNIYFWCLVLAINYAICGCAEVEFIEGAGVHKLAEVSDAAHGRSSRIMPHKCSELIWVNWPRK